MNRSVRNNRQTRLSLRRTRNRSTRTFNLLIRFNNNAIINIRILRNFRTLRIIRRYNARINMSTPMFFRNTNNNRKCSTNSGGGRQHTSRRNRNNQRISQHGRNRRNSQHGGHVRRLQRRRFRRTLGLLSTFTNKLSRVQNLSTQPMKQTRNRRFTMRLKARDRLSPFNNFNTRTYNIYNNRMTGRRTSSHRNRMGRRITNRQNSNNTQGTRRVNKTLKNQNNIAKRDI